MPTTNQVKQASDAIKNAGYEPTPALIERVIDEKVRDGRASYATATDRALKGTQTGSTAPTGNAPTGSGDNVGDTLKATTEALAKSIKKKVLTDALQIVISDFSVGDFGSFDINLGESQTLDVDFSQVLSSSSFTALPAHSHDTSLPLLSASTEDSND